MSTLNCYQREIITITGCKPEDAPEIEDYMRDIIFESTLDWQPKYLFAKAAREAWEDIRFMRTPEGIQYMKLLKLSFN